MYQYTIKPIGDLIPYVNNSRTHDDEQVTQLASSMKEFGFTNPVLIDEQDGLIAGHGRVLAAKRLGLEEIPAIIVDGLTEAQKKALVIADNQLALNADWDIDKLKLEVDTLGELDFDLDLLGFDADFLKDLMADPIEQGKTDEDSVPEVVENPVTVEGDVWVLGKHRLMCGDSTSIDAVEKLMDGNAVDLVFTDIPYNISQESNGLRNIDYGDWDKGVADIGIKVQAHNLGDTQYYFCDDEQLSGILSAMKSNGMSTRTFVWKKTNPTVMNGEKLWLPSQELCAYGKKPKATFNGKCVHAFWEGSPEGNRVHPNQKPVKLVEICIMASSNNSDAVLDYFGGSGSTLIACEKTNRNAFLMELDPKYCDVIIKRWQDFTGKQATLEESGKTYDDISSERS